MINDHFEMEPFEMRNDSVTSAQHCEQMNERAYGADLQNHVGAGEG